MLKKTLLIVFLLISILSLLIVSCKQTPISLYTYQPPENLDDGLEVGSLDDVGINTELIEKGVDEISRGKYREVHSMLIFKDNKLVFEKYFYGHKYKWDGPDYHGIAVAWGSSKPHCLQSVTKSITSACIGIAVDKGFIRSVNQSIFDYLPEYQRFNTDGKDQITIEHLLTMSSGLKWDEWGAPNNSPDNDAIGLWFCEDPIAFVLERPLIYEPGTSFTYNGGGMDVLSEIIKNASKMDIDKFSAKYLFEPLGIDSFDWYNRFENGMIDAASGLKLTPRDMIKIGVTFLNNGVWNGEQIISGQWVEKSSVSYPGPGNSWFNNFIRPIPPDEGTMGRRGYSYSWWTHQFSNSGKKINIFYAGGWGGQNIMVLPELNTVAVFTGGNYTSNVQTFKILDRYIIPAFS